jgi:hypothetical protein
MTNQTPCALVTGAGRGFDGIVNIASESSPFRPPFQICQSTKMALECLADVMRCELQLSDVHAAIIRLPRIPIGFDISPVLRPGAETQLKPFPEPGPAPSPLR